MTESQDSSNSWNQWLSGAVVAILIIAVLLLAFFFTRSSKNDTVPVGITPISGGVAVPASLSGTDKQGDASAETDTTPQPLAVGAKVTNISPSGAGTRLYSDVGVHALVMDVYQDGASFTIMEPSDDHHGYPVQNDDTDWYRVRTSDGLVGWAMAEQLVPLE